MYKCSRLVARTALTRWHGACRKHIAVEDDLRLSTLGDQLLPRSTNSARCRMRLSRSTEALARIGPWITRTDMLRRSRKAMSAPLERSMLPCRAVAASPHSMLDGSDRSSCARCSSIPIVRSVPSIGPMSAASVAAHPPARAQVVVGFLRLLACDDRDLALDRLALQIRRCERPDVVLRDVVLRLALLAAACWRSGGRSCPCARRACACSAPRSRPRRWCCRRGCRAAGSRRRSGRGRRTTCGCCAPCPRSSSPSRASRRRYRARRRRGRCSFMAGERVLEPGPIALAGGDAAGRAEAVERVVGEDVRREGLVPHRIGDDDVVVAHLAVGRRGTSG